MFQFLHHFIASTVQCRNGSFNKVIVEDMWMLDMSSNGVKMNLTRYMINKMIQIVKEKELSVSKTSTPQVIVPYVN